MSGSLMAKDLEGVIVDIDGTICRGDELIPGADDAIKAFRGRGIDVYFVTNNASKSQQHYVRRLGRAGIDATPDSIISSGMLAVEFLKARYADANVYLVGEEPLKRALVSEELSVTSDPSDAQLLLVGLDTEFTYEKLADAQCVLENGGTYVATNMDATRPSANRRVPSTGSLLAAITTASGREPDYVTGKPSNIAIETCINTLSIEDPSEWCVIGDRLNTDVEFGRKAGMTTVLISTGVHSGANVRELDITPDHVFGSISDVADEL